MTYDASKQLLLRVYFGSPRSILTTQHTTPTHFEWCILTARLINNKTSYYIMNVGKLSNFFLLRMGLVFLLHPK